MNCPKCETLLIKRPYSPAVFYCIGCGLEGATYEEFVRQLPRIQHIYDATLARVRCQICEESIVLRDASETRDGYICRSHRK